MLNKNSLILYVFKSIQKINITNFTQPVLRINNRLIFRHRRIVCNVYIAEKNIREMLESMFWYYHITLSRLLLSYMPFHITVFTTVKYSEL